MRELLLIAAMWAAYSLGRKVANGHLARAFANAGRVWDLERAMRLPSETNLQHHIIGRPWIAIAANCYYAGVHFPATAAFLLWLYLARPANYRTVRNLLAALTAVAMVIHNLYPLAPPRMLAEASMVDTAQRWGPAVYGGSPETDKLANQFAAMPSLHVGWAVLVAVTLIVLTRSRWRWLWLLHPVTTTLVVVVTANHYWLDGMVGTGLLLMVFLLGLALRQPAADLRLRLAERRAGDAHRARRGGFGHFTVFQRFSAENRRINGETQPTGREVARRPSPTAELGYRVPGAEEDPAGSGTAGSGTAGSGTAGSDVTEPGATGSDTEIVGSGAGGVLPGRGDS